MSNLNKAKKKELTLRPDDGTLARLEWAEYCRKDLNSRNQALLEAVQQWLDKMELRYGKPPSTISIVAPKGKRA